MTFCDPPDLEDVLRDDPPPPCENRHYAGLAQLRDIVLQSLLSNEHMPSIFTVL
jgi:hypothetical protein